MSRRSGADKSLGGKVEDYPTPRWCMDRLLERVHLPAGTWLEPCAGHGAIVRRVLELRGDVVMNANDIQAHNAAKIHAAGARVVHTRDATDWGGRPRLDHLVNVGAAQPNWAHWEADVVITNPPYSLAVDLVCAMRQVAPMVVMLLRLGWLASAKRHPLWGPYSDGLAWPLRPREIWVLPDRPIFRGDHGDSADYGWFVWGPEQVPNGHTRLGHLGLTPAHVRKDGREWSRSAPWLLS